MPLLGIVEEVGEHAEARNDRSPQTLAATEAKIKDALADAMIFTADYCTAMGWDLGELWEQASAIGRLPMSLTMALGRAARAHLKQEQHVRQGEDHKAAGKQAMVYVIAHLISLADFDLAAETHKIWQKVKLRDWKKDPVRAGEV